MKNILVVLVITALVIAYLNACSESPNLNDPYANRSNKIITYHPPDSVVITFEEDTVFINDTTMISCAVSDPDENDTFTYAWSSFKVSENSTDNEYNLDYQKNLGMFLQGGANPLWTPGMAEGKYIIICYVKDKADYEVSDTKIINVIDGLGYTAFTNQFKYYTDGTFNQENQILYTIRNHSIDTLVAIFNDVDTGVERKENDVWQPYYSSPNWYYDHSGFAWLDVYPYSEKDIVGCVPIIPGIYRLNIICYDEIYYNSSGQGPSLTRFYSTEFEVVLE